MPHASEAKEALRAAIGERLSRMSAKDKEAESRSLCRRVLQELPKERANICAFVPMKDEVDIRPLLEEVLKLGHALYLPCFENALVFRKIHDLSTLTKGPFGFLQPPVTEPALAMSENVTVLVPGRAFTSDGHRLGRGNGGYDIWMRKKRQASPKSTYWGVCYDCQIVHDLPTEEHDERVTRVITARGIATIS